MMILQPQTFYALDLPTSQLNPFHGASKHVRLAYNPFKRKHWTQGGDWGTGSGDNRCFEFDLRSNTWTLASTYCHGAGKITPLHPDESPVVYDAKRRKIVAMGGNNVGGPTGDGTTCSNPPGVTGPAGSTYRYATLSFPDDVREWVLESRSVPPSGSAAQIDLIRDEMITFSGTGGQRCNHIRLSDYKVDHRVSLDRLGFSKDAKGNGFTEVSCHGDHWAQDNIGRKAYFLAGRGIIRNHEAVRGENEPLFFSVDLDTDKIEILPPPPLPGKLKVRFNMVQITWDARRRAVVYFHTRTVCGTVHNVYVYRPHVREWETHPVTMMPGVDAPVRGNVAWYDPDEQVHCLSGGVFCGDEGRKEVGLSSTQLYLWQLGA